MYWIHNQSACFEDSTTHTPNLPKTIRINPSTIDSGHYITLQKEREIMLKTRRIETNPNHIHSIK